MKTRQLRKQLARTQGKPFYPIFNELHNSGLNHEQRRVALSRKGGGFGSGWRVRHWKYGMRKHPRLQQRRFRKLAGGRVGTW